MRRNAGELKNKKAETARRAASALLAEGLWQAVSLLPVGSVLIASPWAVLVRLGELVRLGSFWLSVWTTLWHIAAGFFLGFAVGAAAAALAARFPAAETLLRPYFVTVRSVPVASFIVIALVWLSSRNISIFISFLMVFPVLYANLLEGLKSRDRKLAEMARVFRIPAGSRFWWVTLPQLKPHLLSGCSAALGLAWKAGVAAEIIGIPAGTVGERLYMAKVYFDTAELFAWTVVIVAASVAFEKLFTGALKLLYRRLERT